MSNTRVNLPNDVIAESPKENVLPSPGEGLFGLSMFTVDLQKSDGVAERKETPVVGLGWRLNGAR